MNREWNNLLDIDVLEGSYEPKQPIPKEFSESGATAAINVHRQLPAYSKTPLYSLSALAEKLHVKNIYIKDESQRFSLNAFKGLGGIYAMFRMICDKLGLDPTTTTIDDLQSDTWAPQVSDIVFVTATDGNHGRGVSWAGGIFGCQVHVYMPKGTVEQRAAAIRNVGPADVEILDSNYDEAARYARKQSEKHGWLLIQDAASDGYEQYPIWIIQGYLTMVAEALEEMRKQQQTPTHVFLQAGVGAMPAGVVGYLTQTMDKKPVIAIVEPVTVNCIYASANAANGKRHSIQGDPVTIMAGLNCGTPCQLSWPILRDFAEFYISVPDYVAAHGMRAYANPVAGDPKIISGESGAATLGALELILSNPEFAEVREAMNINEDSVILLINSEGDTDPVGYQKIVAEGQYPLPQ